MKEDLGDLTAEFIEMGLGSDFDAQTITAQVVKRTKSEADRPAKKPKIDVDSLDMELVARNQQVRISKLSKSNSNFTSRL